MLNLEDVREYCLKKKGVTEEFPFDSETLVFKVSGKVFLLTGLSSSPFRFNVKMDPGLIPAYRDKYPDVQPGYHMNKNHWNTVNATNKISKKELLWMIDHSYEMVIKGLTKKDREKLNRST
ncbi:MAG: MmcQ/YjbR family DNA-binding protein [Fimbriimonadaceae bacterium]|nr:MmcQ/YjbR family DNA-binding protein [Chitinophagales bacterium]